MHVPAQTFTLLDVAIAGAVTGQVGSVTVPVLGRVLDQVTTPNGDTYRTANDLPTVLDGLLLHAIFAYGAGGTTVKSWVQTSIDGGITWIDIASFAFTLTAGQRIYHLTGAAVTSILTPTDGTLADNTSVNGVLGQRFRVKYTTTGTYTGATSLTIVAMPR